MGIEQAKDAIETGCCLELYFERYSMIVEPHAVGTDRFGRSLLLAFERCMDALPTLGQWLFLPLDKARMVEVSGYLSEAPRPGYRPDDSRFIQILSQLPEVERAQAA